MPVLVEILKMAALAALAGMLCSLALTPFWAAFVGLLAFWLLTVKAS